MASLNLNWFDFLSCLLFELRPVLSFMQNYRILIGHDGQCIVNKQYDNVMNINWLMLRSHQTRLRITYKSMHGCDVTGAMQICDFAAKLARFQAIAGCYK